MNPIAMTTRFTLPGLPGINLQVPTFRLPAFVTRIGQSLPQWPHALGLVGGLNGLLLLKLLDAEALEPLTGRVFAVEVEDTAAVARFTFDGLRFVPLLAADGPAPDLTFRATLSAYLQLLARQEDPDTLFFQRRLVIEGDTELGLLVKNLLDAVEWPRLPFIAERT